MGKATRIRNATERGYIHNFLKTYVLGGFKWEGLPYGLTSQQIEQYICCNGLAVGFNHPRAGAVVLPAVWGAPLNLYYLPNDYEVWGSGWSGRVSVDKSVAFYDNSSRRSLANLIERTDQSLRSIIDAQRLNISHQKNPWIFAGNEDEKQSLLASLQAVDENVPAFIVSKSALTSIETAKKFFPTNVPFLAQDFQQAFRQELNTFLTVLGYDNVTIEKKERLITDEAHSNDSSILFHRMDRLRMREEACEGFNKMFGMSLSVKWVGCTDCDSKAETDRQSGGDSDE